MLRDMRTRFGGTLWGYGIVVMWPCVHVFMLIAIYTFQHCRRPSVVVRRSSSPRARCRS